MENTKGAKYHECMTMDESKKHQPLMTSKADSPPMEAHPVAGTGCSVSELLEDSGNCRQMINQEMNHCLLVDSLLTEQQKLRHVLDWAHRFLSSGSEVHSELCSVDSFMLADEKRKKSPVGMRLSASRCHHLASCTAGGTEVFGGEGDTQKVFQLNYENSESNDQICTFSDDPNMPFSFTPGEERNEVTWPEYIQTPGNIKVTEPHDAANKQTPRQESKCRTSSLFMSNQRQHTSLSNTDQTSASDGATSSIKDSTSCWSYNPHKRSKRVDTANNSKMCHKVSGGRSETDTSGLQMELSKSNIRSSDSERTRRQMEKTSNVSTSCHFKIPQTLSVCEQYQLCVAQLQRLRMRQSCHIDSEHFIELPGKERKSCEAVSAPVEAPALHTSDFDSQSSTTNIKKPQGSKQVSAAEITNKMCPDVNNKNRDRSESNRSRTTPSGHGQTKYCDNLTKKETLGVDSAERRSVCQSNTVTHEQTNKRDELAGGAAGDINTFTEDLGTAPGDDPPAAEESASLMADPGLFPKKIRRWSFVKGRKRNARGRGASLSSLTNKEIFQRPRSSGVIKHTPEDKLKPGDRYTHTYLQPPEIHTPLHDDPALTSPAASVCQCEETDPAGVPVRACWLRLSDEVWLSILSLLPHSDLCRVAQVCSRLHTLACDQTLWKSVRIENSNLTEQWLLCVGRRRPRSLCLCSCSGLYLTSSGMKMFFSLCGSFLEELKVTSCTGPVLHGDQILPLIGQLCGHVTTVDVSWSGTSDTGVKALSDCCSELRIKSVTLNGCHVTDDPLRKLVIRHRESLRRLEVFGCHFLTPSCLQTLNETCPELQHLNIGQVPKVDAHSLTLMSSQLKCLISLNLTGLQAVTDATVETLLQNCIKLQSLALSSCPGVSDLTLHHIRKYTPRIRSLDVSRCKAVTDAGVQSLALGCRRLEQLDLSSTSTGNRGVTLLSNYCSGHLRTVKLSFCHITLDNILKLCRRCKRLKVLHLYGCANVPTQREIRRVNTAVKVYPPP